MPIVTVTTEKSLDELLNKLAGTLDQVGFARLRNVILGINPHLHIEGSFMPGKMIMVPGLEHLNSDNLFSGSEIKAWIISEPLISAIQAYFPRLESRLRSRVKELDDVDKRLKSQTFMNSVSSMKSAKVEEFLKQVKENVKAEHAVSKKELGELSNDMDVLQKDLLKVFKN